MAARIVRHWPYGSALTAGINGAGDSDPTAVSLVFEYSGMSQPSENLRVKRYGVVGRSGAFSMLPLSQSSNSVGHALSPVALPVLRALSVR